MMMTPVGSSSPTTPRSEAPESPPSPSEATEGAKDLAHVKSEVTGEEQQQQQQYDATSRSGESPPSVVKVSKKLSLEFSPATSFQASKTFTVSCTGVAARPRQWSDFRHDLEMDKQLRDASMRVETKRQVWLLANDRGQLNFTADAIACRTERKTDVGFHPGCAPYRVPLDLRQKTELRLLRCLSLIAEAARHRKARVSVGEPGLDQHLMRSLVVRHAFPLAHCVAQYATGGVETNGKGGGIIPKVTCGTFFRCFALPAAEDLQGSKIQQFQLTHCTNLTNAETTKQSCLELASFRLFRVEPFTKEELSSFVLEFARLPPPGGISYRFDTMSARQAKVWKLPLGPRHVLLQPPGAPTTTCTTKQQSGSGVLRGGPARSTGGVPPSTTASIQRSGLHAIRASKAYFVTPEEMGGTTTNSGSGTAMAQGHQSQHPEKTSKPLTPTKKNEPNLFNAGRRADDASNSAVTMLRTTTPSERACRLRSKIVATRDKGQENAKLLASMRAMKK